MTDTIHPLVAAPAGRSLPTDSGAKVVNLQRLDREGIPVPPTLFLPPEAYFAFVRHNGFTERVRTMAEADMDGLRWEEIWDASLALRNMFLRGRIPDSIAVSLLDAVRTHLDNAPLAVRSCSRNEDSGLSHAGMHETELNVHGRDEILRAVRIVWASLWSDRAMLYRKEMALRADASGMGVILQPMIPGRASGVMFTKDPTDESRLVIEAVSGLARDVVDDAVESERTLLARSTGEIVGRKSPGPQVVDNGLAAKLFRIARKVEEIFSTAQDVEWTMGEKGLVILQSRPITTLSERGDESGWDKSDKRPWYLSLTRSHENLLHLRERIESAILPEMQEDSRRMKALDLEALSPEELKRELTTRKQRLDHWRDVYWRELIPFAHTVRQFGMLYNDAVTPDDPFEFTTLLSGQHLLAVERNALLEDMAELVRHDPKLAAELRGGRLPESGPYSDRLEAFMETFGDLACSTSWCDEGPWGIIRLTLDAVPQHPRPGAAMRSEELEQRFLNAFPNERREFAASVLELARTGYRLRDDDNIHLGRIQARFNEALERARALGLELPETEPEAKKAMPKGLAWHERKAVSDESSGFTGWPAASGIARGPARVVMGPNDLFSFRKGEVLVCDALDPNMTFVAPMACAVVERRGGMLVHGAIIAREYGIPCVTGIPEATSRIRTGQWLMVDGFRGLVTMEDATPRHDETARNVLGKELQPCGRRPMTGFFRHGTCRTGPQDSGSHVVCARMTKDFLEFTRSRGNDLISPAPQHGFPGLVPGDTWCLCALRWEEAREEGLAPPVLLECTHEAATRHVSLEDLHAHAEEPGTALD